MTPHTVRTVWLEDHFLYLCTSQLPATSFGDYLVFRHHVPKFFFDRHPPVRPLPAQFNIRAGAKHGLYVHALWTPSL